MSRKRLIDPSDNYSFLKKILKNREDLNLDLNLVDTAFLYGIEMFTLNGRSTLSSIGTYLKYVEKLDERTGVKLSLHY